MYTCPPSHLMLLKGRAHASFMCLDPQSHNSHLFTYLPPAVCPALTDHVVS